jgi:hypothetical protein
MENRSFGIDATGEAGDENGQLTYDNGSGDEGESEGEGEGVGADLYDTPDPSETDYRILGEAGTSVAYIRVDPFIVAKEDALGLLEQCPPWENPWVRENYQGFR